MKDRLIKLFRSEALRTRVWVSDKYRYTMQMVKLLPMSGLNVGERVAASANFLIDSESNLKEAIVRNVTQSMITNQTPGAPPRPNGSLWVMAAGTPPSMRRRSDEITRQSPILV